MSQDRIVPLQLSLCVYDTYKVLSIRVEDLKSSEYLVKLWNMINELKRKLYVRVFANVTSR